MEGENPTSGILVFKLSSTLCFLPSTPAFRIHLPDHPNLDLSCSTHLAFGCPHSTSHLNLGSVPRASYSRPYHLVAKHCHCHCHCRPLGFVPALEEAFVPDLLVAALEEDVGHLGSWCTQKRRKCFHEGSPKHEHRRSKPTVVRNDEGLAQAAAGAAVVAGAAEDRSKVDPVAGKELIDMKSQKMQVRLGHAQWGLDTRIHHRSHDDQ